MRLSFCGLSAHEMRKFVMDNFYHELAWLHRCEHILSKRFLLYGVCEALCHFVIDIGFEQCSAYIFECLSYVDFGDLAFTFEYLERLFQSFA